jgi:hypothetical protein
MFVCIYDLLKAVSDNSRMLNIAFIFGFAGIISSYFGTIVWNGCLDYIYLKPLFVFDLKDLYINVFLILFAWYYLKNKKLMSSFKTKDMVSHFKNRFTSQSKNGN